MAATPLPEIIIVSRPAPESRPAPIDPPPGQPEPTVLGQPPLPFGAFEADPVAVRTADTGTSCRWPMPVSGVPPSRWRSSRLCTVDDRSVSSPGGWTIASRPPSRSTAGRSPAISASRPAVLRSVRVQYPRPDAAEVCAHLSQRAVICISPCGWRSGPGTGSARRSR